jgi:hypothetical protein
MTRSPATGPSPWSLLSRAGALWLGTVLGVLGVVFAIIGVRDAYTERQYHTQGLTVAVTVTDKSIERAKRGENSRTRYLVSYRFTSSDGQDMESSAEVPVEDWERLGTGQTFPVSYLPDTPGSSRAQGSGEDAWIAIYVFLAIGAVFTLLVGSLAYSDLRVILRTIRVSRHGLMTEGTMVTVRPTGTSINRVPQWRLSYRYRDHLGRTQEGASHFLSPEEASAWKAGDRGTVRFDHERPEISVWMGAV